MDIRRHNPFRPGPGTAPAHLAGRDGELRAIREAMDALAAPRDDAAESLEAPARPLFKIAGPRGVGKTILLNEARLMAEERDIPTILFHWRDAYSTVVFKLALILDKEGCWDEVRKKVESEQGLKDGEEFGLELQEEVLEKLLEQFLQRRPLALLMDEAMEEEPEVLGMLLRVCHRLIGKRRPLAFLLAGTPHLDGKLAKASFSGEVQSLYINELKPEATREALRKPLEEGGFKVKDEALELMAGMTDDYPFFIQVVGFEVWEAMAEHGREEVDEKAVRRAEAGIQRRQKQFHQRIHDHMVRVHMLDHVLGVTRLLRLHGGRLTKEEVLASLAKDASAAGQARAQEAFAELVDRNCIWPRDGRLEAGFPSFLSFCEERQE